MIQRRNARKKENLNGNGHKTIPQRSSERDLLGRKLKGRQKRFMTVEEIQQERKELVMKVLIGILLAMTFYEILFGLPPWRSHTPRISWLQMAYKVMYWSYQPTAYLSPADQWGRSRRFPSVEDRVRVYMSAWYVPPCSEADKLPFAVFNVTDESQWLAPVYEGEHQKDSDSGSNAVKLQETIGYQQVYIQEVSGFDPGRKGIYVLQDELQMAQLLSLGPELFDSCDTENEYCFDTLDSLLPSLERVEAEEDELLDIPIVAQFGESSLIRGYNYRTQQWDPFPSIPHLMKYRFAYEDSTAVDAMTASDCSSGAQPIYRTMDVANAAKLQDYYQPIIWKLSSAKHFSMIPSIPEHDIPFHRKKDMAVFRGSLSGLFSGGYATYMKEQISDMEKCLLIHRCRLVYDTADSQHVDAKLVDMRKGQHQELPSKIGDVPIYGEKYSYKEMLQYKAIIVLEGNDVSSGLKWALFSNSVVITQNPTRTSWALEEMLEPWVHYVPIADDLSDVAEKTMWVIDNPEPAKRIAHAGSLWVRDLLFHPDAKRDDEMVHDEILRRYRNHFRYDPWLGS